MDGNKDEALKCWQIGREAFESGDRARALKFITKARRLDPNLPVDDLLSSIEGESGDRRAENGGDVAAESPTANSSKQGIRNRAPANGSSSSSSSMAYTEEQVLIVREIKKKKDYYEILGLERGCSVEDVRKGYRKLSLKVHPDKNKAPGAEEAFKAVSKAFQCLSDEESRKRYDLVGSEEPAYERRPARRAQQGFNGFYDDVDAEEIFRNFFFGGMPQATTQFRGFQFGTGMRQRTGDQGSDGLNIRVLIQLLPILLIILLQFLPSSEPVYSLSRSYQYQHQFSTQRGVNYYVKTANYEQEYPFDSPERAALEAKIEREYSSIVTQNCRVEMQRRQWGFVQETPYCDMLERFHQAA